MTATACTPSPDGDDLAHGSQLPARSTQHSDAGEADGSTSTTSNNNNGGGTPTNPDPAPPASSDDAGSPVDSGPVNNPPPAPTPPCGELGVNKALTTDQSLASCDKRFTLVMQSDGNLVLYKNGVGALWSSNSYGTGGQRAIMQGDGNFVVYTATNLAVFNTGTQNHPGAFIAVQNDGNLVVYQNGVALWASNTAGN